MKGSGINGFQVPSPSPVENDSADDRQHNATSNVGHNPFGEYGERNSEQLLLDGLNPSKLFIPSSNSPRCSIGSSASDHLSFESQLLEVAIRTNDVSKVKHFLMIHRDKFQINSKPPENTFNNAPHNSEINSQKTKTQTVRSDNDDSPRDSLSSDGQALLSFKNALHMAIDHGSLDVVRTLLENGINPNAGGHVPPDAHRQSRSQSPPFTATGLVDVPSAGDGQCTIDEDAALGPANKVTVFADRRTCTDVHVPAAREPRPNRELVIVPASPSPTSAVVAIAERSANRSVILRQRSLSLDNEKPLKKSRALFQRLRAGCSKLIRSTPAELYVGGGSLGHPQAVPVTVTAVAGPEQPRKATCAAAGFMATAPVELKGIMSELRRSSDVVRAILWNLSFRDTYSSGNVSDIDSSNELDVDTLFDRHEQRRYADYEMENGGRLPLLDSLSSLQSFQSLSSAGSCSAAGSTAPEPAPAVFKLQFQTSPLTQQQPSMQPQPQTPPSPPPPPPPLSGY
uniref:Uncharacterized protein n=1 Tax=Sipha flava TaxID=143950 RepID=A0A2S2Q074_9HEMI